MRVPGRRFARDLVDQVTKGKGERVDQGAGIDGLAADLDDAQTPDVGQHLGGDVCATND
jgi:hypothetical protein